MSLSLSAFYILYLILVGIFFLFSFFNLYHLLRFGSPVAVTVTISTVYLVGATVMLATSFVLLSTIDWSQSIELLPAPGGFGGFG